MSLGQETRNFFAATLKQFVDPQSGWSGSSELACNAILRANAYGQSPYQIPGASSSETLNLYNTCNLVNNSSKDLASRQTRCTSTNFTTTPCYGPRGVATQGGSFSVDAGCDGSNKIWTYPNPQLNKEASKSRLPPVKDPLTKQTVHIGNWKKVEGSWGPTKSTGTMPQAPRGETWTGKGHYETKILAVPTASEGVTGSNATVATIHINYVTAKAGDIFSNTDILNRFLSFMSFWNNIQAAPTLKNPNGTENVNRNKSLSSKILGDAKSMFDNSLKNVEHALETFSASIAIVLGLIAAAPVVLALLADPLTAAEGAIAQAAWNTSVDVELATLTATIVQIQVAYIEFITALAELSVAGATYGVEKATQKAIMPPFMKDLGNILDKYMVEIPCKGKGGFLKIDYFQCKYSQNNKKKDFIKNFSTAFLSANRKSIADQLKNYYNFCTTNNIKLFDPNQIIYKPVSVALVMPQSCGIISSNSQGPVTTSFPYAKIGGVCIDSGCDGDNASPYCACDSTRQYICPFSTYPKNLTACQQLSSNTPNVAIKDSVSFSIPGGKKADFDSLRSRILLWLNTFVGTNGCYQRSMGMNYGKCLTLNQKALQGFIWNPQDHSIKVNEEMDSKLFSMRNM